MIIDVHTHAFPDTVAAKAVPQLSQASGFTVHHAGTLGSLRDCLGHAGVSMAVVQPIATKPAQVRSINDWAMENAGDNIRFFATLHPDFAQYRDELRRVRRECPAIRGIKLHPNYQDFHPDDPRLRPMFQACAAEDFLVLFHAGHDAAFVEAPGSPDRIARLLDAVPDLRVICAHFGGWKLWDDVETHLLGRPNVYLETSFTIGYLPGDRMREMARRHGVERVLFGSDSPWRDQAADLAALGRMGFNADELDGILGRNAASLLGIDPAELH
jgi:hypothetical protein